MNVREEELTVIPEVIFDLHGLHANGIDLISIISYLRWHHYISLLNGPTYSELVKYVWVRVEVYDKEAVEEELRRERERESKGSQQCKVVKKGAWTEGFR
jgi:hypothetical protein